VLGLGVVVDRVPLRADLRGLVRAGEEGDESSIATLATLDAN